MRIRKTGADELAALKRLWMLGFDDTQAETDTFFELLYPTALSFCAEEDGQVIAAAYALPQTLVWDEKSCKAAYIYAVTTHPQFRRQGVCKTLLTQMEKDLRKRYFDCLLLVPASQQLRRYYESLGYTSQKSSFLEEGASPQPCGICEELSAQDYAGLRETLLYDRPHVRYALKELRYQASMAGFYRLELGTHQGCASAYLDGETLVVSEILPDAALLPALVKKFPAATCRVHTIGKDDTHVMCKWLSAAQTPPVYLGFDFG